MEASANIDPSSSKLESAGKSEQNSSKSSAMKAILAISQVVTCE
jgi:hypothetical protein